MFEKYYGKHVSLQGDSDFQDLQVILKPLQDIHLYHYFRYLGKGYKDGN